MKKSIVINFILDHTCFKHFFLEFELKFKPFNILYLAVQRIIFSDVLSYDAPLKYNYYLFIFIFSDDENDKKIIIINAAFNKF